MDSVDVKLMDLNLSPLTERELEECKNDNATRNWPKTPFPIDKEINKKVILYNGDVGLLKADAVVNSTNESLSQIGVFGKLAGPELEKQLKRYKFCATGDVRLTPGYRSNFKYIIHAVPPKYQSKYKTAAETALFHTYFRVLETVIEKKLRTVIIPTLSSPKCNLPIQGNCHMQLRIIRRILEKKQHEFDRIVILVQTGDLYVTPFFCYFPQTSLDEEIACYKLPTSVGGPNGEPVIPEREIRIKSKPAGFNDQSIDLQSGLDLSTVVGKTAFSKMQDDLDKQRSSLNGTICGTTTSTLAIRPMTIRKTVFRGCTLL